MITSLVVGGAGFIGANLVHELLLAGHRCVVIDDGSGLGGLRSLPKEAHLVSMDAAKLGELKLGRIDFVFYLAAKCAGISFNMHHQTEMLLSNIRALYGLKHCFQLKPRKLVFFSTACVYPSWAPVPTSEPWGHWGLPEKTNLGYGLAKRIGEIVVKLFQFRRGTPTMIIRPSNTFGPWDYFDEAYGHFVPSVLTRMLQGKPVIRIWGGTQTRAFIFVSDVVRVALALLNSDIDSSTVNIGHSNELSIVEAYEVMREETNYRGDVEFVAGPIGYRRRLADERRLNSLIGQVNWTSFRDGIRKTVAWLVSDEYRVWAGTDTQNRPQPLSPYLKS